MITSQLTTIELNQIKIFNTALERHINRDMQPPLDGQLQMRVIAIFNKYWLGKLDIKRFVKLWLRLVGPIYTIKKYQFDWYFVNGDIDFIDQLNINYRQPSIH
jgi:hypothetical protein